MEQQELFYPDLLVTIGDYQFDQGITLKACIDRNRPFDWGKISFSNPYKEHIQVQAQDEQLRQYLPAVNVNMSA